MKYKYEGPVEIPVNENGWARYSFLKGPPPEKDGYKIIHVRAHRHNGAWIPERWFYNKVDENGKVFRGQGAREKMLERGITQSNPSPEELTVPPDNVTSIVEPFREGLTPPGQHRRSKVKPKENVVNVVRKEVMASPEAMWVPVYYKEDGQISGWMDINNGRFLRQAELTPGLSGVVRNDMRLIGSPQEAAWDRSARVARDTSAPVAVRRYTKVRKNSPRATSSTRGDKLRGRPSNRVGVKNPGITAAVLSAMQGAPSDGIRPAELVELMDGYPFKGNAQHVVGVLLATKSRREEDGIVRVGHGKYALRQ